MKRMGLDSLSLEVSMPDGIYYFTETSTSAQITGAGTISQTIIKDIIPLIHQLKQLMRKMHKSNSKINHISMTPGLIKIFQSMLVFKSVNSAFLKKLRDQGNDFELKITYQFYEGVLKEDTNINTGDDFGMSPEDPWAEQEVHHIYQ